MDTIRRHGFKHASFDFLNVMPRRDGQDKPGAYVMSWGATCSTAVDRGMCNRCESLLFFENSLMRGSQEFDRLFFFLR
jgi:hypothetical protein